MRARLSLAALALLLLGCTGLVPPGPAAPSSSLEAESALCPDVCANYQRLGCAAGAPTPWGTSCEEVCHAAIASGMVRWRMECRAAARSCRAAEACEP